MFLNPLENPGFFSCNITVGQVPDAILPWRLEISLCHLVFSALILL